MADTAGPELRAATQGRGCQAAVGWLRRVRGRVRCGVPLAIGVRGLVLVFAPLPAPVTHQLRIMLRSRDPSTQCHHVAGRYSTSPAVSVTSSGRAWAS